MNVRQIQTDPHFQSVGQAAAGVVADAKAKMQEADRYRYWREELATPDCNSRDTDRRDLAGFYRIVGAETKPDYPVAIWPDEATAKLYVKVGRQEAFLEGGDAFWDFLGSAWLKCRAVPHEHYEKAIDTGRWPDMKGARKDAQAPTPSVLGERGLGDNLPDDPHEAAKIEFEGEKEAAEEILRKPIRTQEEANRAAVASKRLSDLHGKVDKMFRAKKDPIVVAGREVDEEFRWREEPKNLSARLKKAQEAFLIEQDRLERERQRRAREEELRLQREADEKARKAAVEANRASDAERERLQREADEAAAAAAAKAREAQAQTVSAGRTGAKVSLRTFYVAKVTDYDKLVMALKDTPEVREAVEKVAGSIARGKGPVPSGMERVEEKRAA